MRLINPFPYLSLQMEKKALAPVGADGEERNVVDVEDVVRGVVRVLEVLGRAEPGRTPRSMFVRPPAASVPPMRAISLPSAPLRRPRLAIEDTPREETSRIVEIDDREESLSPPAPAPTSAEEASAAAAPGATGAIPRRETLQQCWEALRNAATISTSWAKGVEKRRAELEAVDALRAAREERKKAAAEASQAQQELRAAQSDLILAPAVNVLRAPAPAVAPAPAPAHEQEHPVRRAGRQLNEKDCFVCVHPNVGRSSRCPNFANHRGIFVGRKGPKKE